MKKQDLEQFRAFFLDLADKAFDKNFEIEKSGNSENKDAIDQLQAHLEHQMTEQLEKRKYAQWKMIMASLKRIDAGLFGQCEECDGEISIKRLKARPTASTCIHCQDEKERVDRQRVVSERKLTSKQTVLTQIIPVAFGDDPTDQGKIKHKEEIANELSKI